MGDLQQAYVRHIEEGDIPPGDQLRCASCRGRFFTIDQQANGKVYSTCIHCGRQHDTTVVRGTLNSLIYICAWCHADHPTGECKDNLVFNS